MAALQGSGVPVPKLLLLCEDVAVIGTPFYVMDFVAGRVLEDTTLAAQTPAERTAIYASLCETMAALHRVDLANVGLERFGRPTGYIQRQLKCAIAPSHRAVAPCRHLLASALTWQDLGRAVRRRGHHCAGSGGMEDGGAALSG